MNKVFFLLLTFSSILCNAQNKQSYNAPTEILILGTLHFNQFHDLDSPSRDFSGKKRQKEFADVVNKLSQFNTDAVLIEREPKHQKITDSLYSINTIDYTSLPDGMSEVYQIGFKLAKTHNLKTVYNVDYYESIPQNLFKNGQNIQVFQDSLTAFQTKGRAITSDFLKGESSITDFLIELNKNENIKISHRLLFNTPAYVTNGNFRNQDKYTNVDSKYIGAEYISLFYNRNLKIYTNILDLTRKIKPKRIVLIIGQVHVGVLQELFNNNPNYKIINANTYLNN